MYILCFSCAELPEAINRHIPPSLATLDRILADNSNQRRSVVESLSCLCLVEPSSPDQSRRKSSVKPLRASRLDPAVTSSMSTSTASSAPVPIKSHQKVPEKRLSRQDSENKCVPPSIEATTTVDRAFVALPSDSLSPLAAVGIAEVPVAKLTSKLTKKSSSSRPRSRSGHLAGLFAQSTQVSLSLPCLYGAQPITSYKRREIACVPSNGPRVLHVSDLAQPGHTVSPAVLAPEPLTLPAVGICYPRAPSNSKLSLVKKDVMMTASPAGGAQQPGRLQSSGHVVVDPTIDQLSSPSQSRVLEYSSMDSSLSTPPHVPPSHRPVVKALSIVVSTSPSVSPKFGGWEFGDDV